MNYRSSSNDNAYFSGTNSSSRLNLNCFSQQSRKTSSNVVEAGTSKRFSNKSNLSAARPDFYGFKTPADLLTRRAIWDCPKISSVRTNLRIFRSSELIIKEVETDCSLFVSFFARRSANRCVASLRSCFSKL